MVGFHGYKTNKGDIPKFSEYNGMIEFSKALRKYYEVSTPESREETYKPWLADNVINTQGPWFKGHRKLRKEENIVKDVVYVLAKTLHEEVNMNNTIKSRNHLSGPQRFQDNSLETNITAEDNVVINVMEQPRDYAENTQDELDVIAHEVKIEKRMQKIMIAVSVIFGSILLYAILYKL